MEIPWGLRLANLRLTSLMHRFAFSKFAERKAFGSVARCRPHCTILWEYLLLYFSLWNCQHDLHIDIAKLRNIISVILRLLYV